MEANRSKLTAAFGFLAAVAMGLGAFQVLSRPTTGGGKSGRSASDSAAAAAVAVAQPLVTRRQGDVGPSAAAATATPPARAPVVNPRNSDYINERFPNQIYPVVTMLPNLQRDDPEAYEALVRQHNPDYAKVLDDNARAERDAELMAAQQLREREVQAANAVQAAANAARTPRQ